VAIFANKNYSDLDNLIKDSKIFNKTIEIHKGNIKKAETETITISSIIKMQVLFICVDFNIFKVKS
jgi:hypothetical protein